MSAGKNIAIGCGVIVLAIVAAGFLGFRWVKSNLGLTTDNAKIVAWAEDMVGTAPTADFEPMFGMYAAKKSDDVERNGLRESVLIFVNEEARGSSVTLTIFTRFGQHGFESAFDDFDSNNEGMKIHFDDEIGEAEDFTASWRDQEIPVRLWEGYDDDEVTLRYLAGLVPVGEMTVVLLFQGSPEGVDRNAVQEMLDRIPADWQPELAAMSAAGY